MSGYKPKSKKVSMIFYFEWLETFNELTDEQVGKLCKHMLMYGESLYTGEVIDKPEDREVNLLFTTFKRKIDTDYQNWVDTCKQNRDNRTNAKKTTVNDRQRPSMSVTNGTDNEYDSDNERECD